MLERNEGLIGRICNGWKVLPKVRYRSGMVLLLWVGKTGTGTFNL